MSHGEKHVFEMLDLHKINKNRSYKKTYKPQNWGKLQFLYIEKVLIYQQFEYFYDTLFLV
jgi:hypothetical protein